MNSHDIMYEYLKELELFGLEKRFRHDVLDQ